MGPHKFHCHVHIFLIFLMFCFEVVLPTPVVISSCPFDHFATLSANGNGIISCQACSRCPPGYGVVEECTTTADTVCQLCPIGTFSSRMSGTEACRPCTTCESSGLRKECSPISDTICNKDCPLGQYYDPSTDRCNVCSYCFPDRPNARTVRIVECREQGLHQDYQCSPLPSPDAGDAWAPPLKIAVDVNNRDGRDRGRLTATGRRFDKKGTRGDQNQRTSSDIAEEEFQMDLFVEDNLEFDYSDDFAASQDYYEDSIFDSDDDDDSKIQEDSWDSSSDYPTNIDLIKGNDDNIREQHYDPVVVHGQSQSSQYRQLTAADIGLVVGIALACGFLSFLITAVSCHFLMKRGKNVGQKVSMVAGKAPSSAWTYQDVMPATPEHAPLVQPHTQSRTITPV